MHGTLRTVLLRLGPEHATALALLLVWLLVVIVTGAIQPIFFGQSAFLAVCFALGIMGVLAIGQCFIIISGGLFDLSLATNAAACGYVAAVLLSDHRPLILAIAAALAVGVGYGLVNGLLVVVARLNPIIATLGTTFVGIGLLNMAVAQSGKLPSVPLTEPLRAWGLDRFLGVPWITWTMVILLTVTAMAIAFTRPGQHLLAVGGSAVAAESRGLNLRRTRLVSFGFAGACAGIAGILIAAQFESVRTGIVDSYQFSMIAAAILGGTSLRGGRASFVGLFVGLVLVSTLPTAFAVLQLSSAWTFIATGALLMLAVDMDAVRNKRDRLT